jgi:hypothetical protein
MCKNTTAQFTHTDTLIQLPPHTLTQTKMQSIIAETRENIYSTVAHTETTALTQLDAR